MSRHRAPLGIGLAPLGGPTVSPPGFTRRVRIVGIGAGHPDQLTVEAVRALNDADFAIVADKSGRPGGGAGSGAAESTDPLVTVRRELLARHAPDLEVVPVRDPERNRSVEATGTRAGYEAAVTDWHEARAAAYEQVLLEREGEVVFLVWGDPAFYDSTIRIVERVLARGAVMFEWDVVPGISALQLLAARHRIVLHEVGQPIVVTTGRRLREAVDAGADNVLVMLNRVLELDGLQDWHIWWGADLGTVSERLVSGTVGDVRDEVERARDEVKAEAGWVMDVFLLRRP